MSDCADFGHAWEVKKRLGECLEVCSRCGTMRGNPPAPQPSLFDKFKAAVNALIRERGQGCGCKVYAEDVKTLHDVLRVLQCLAAQPQATPPHDTAAQASDNWRGRMPAKIANPEAWPLNYADGFNDALQLVYEETGIASPPHDTGTERGERAHWLAAAGGLQRFVDMMSRDADKPDVLDGWKAACSWHATRLQTIVDDMRANASLFTHKGMQASEGDRDMARSLETAALADGWREGDRMRLLDAAASLHWRAARNAPQEDGGAE
jgi:hypothetical protein